MAEPVNVGANITAWINLHSPLLNEVLYDNTDGSLSSLLILIGNYNSDELCTAASCIQIKSLYTELIADVVNIHPRYAATLHEAAGKGGYGMVLCILDKEKNDDKEKNEWHRRLYLAKGNDEGVEEKGKWGLESWVDMMNDMMDSYRGIYVKDGKFVQVVKR